MKRKLIIGGIFILGVFAFCGHTIISKSKYNGLFPLNESVCREMYQVTDYKKYALAAEESCDTVVSNLFHALSFAEDIHIRQNRELLDKYNQKHIQPLDPLPAAASTLENLKQAFQKEKRKAEDFFPALLSMVKSDGSSVMEQNCMWAVETSYYHAEQLQYAVRSIELGDSLAVSHYYVCPQCGNLYTDHNLQVYCSICSTHHTSFLEF